MARVEYLVPQKKELVSCAVDFSIILGHLYNMGVDEVLRRYVLEHERHDILAEAHNGVAGGHYAGKETTQKILRVGLWWPTLHIDAHDYCKACDTFQQIGRPSRRD